MDTFRAFKLMKCEYLGQDLVIFRTSRVCRVLGSLFIFAALAIIFNLLVGKLFFSMFYFCLFSLGVAGSFLLTGLVLFTYRKSVIMNPSEQKIQLEESSIFEIRSAAFHFDEIMSVELTKDSECFLSNRGSFWVVKVYLQHYDFSVEKVFFTINLAEAKHVAQTIAYSAGKDLVISCQPEERMLLERV